MRTADAEKSFNRARNYNNHHNGPHASGGIPWATLEEIGNSHMNVKNSKTRWSPLPDSPC